MANVVFDEQSAARIAAAVKWVEQYSLDESTEQESEEDPSADSSARTVIRGTFTGVWGKDTAKDVSFTADNGDSGTKTDVYNYFADVGESGVTSDCVIILAGSEWVLVSAQLTTEMIGHAVRGTFSGSWDKGSTKTVSFSGGTQGATNYFADVGESGVTSACCIIQAGSEWILIAAECG